MLPLFYKHSNNASDLKIKRTVVICFSENAMNRNSIDFLFFVITIKFLQIFFVENVVHDKRFLAMILHKEISSI